MSDSWPAPGPRYAALLQLLRTAETLWQASRSWFGRWRLSPSQFNALNLLRDQPEGLSQTELSRLLIMHRSNLTGLVDGLETRGLVARGDWAGDRRAYRVALTAKGRKLLAEILPGYFAAVEAVLSNLGEARARKLAAEMACLAENARSFSAQGASSTRSKRFKR